MTDVAYKVLTKLRFSAPNSVTADVMCKEFGVGDATIREAIQELRTQVHAGKRYLIIAPEKGKGYLLTTDVHAGIEYKVRLHNRILSILGTEKGVGQAIKFQMDEQGITGTLFAPKIIGDAVVGEFDVF